jgi:hypothetical protein
LTFPWEPFSQAFATNPSQPPPKPQPNRRQPRKNTKISSTKSALSDRRREKEEDCGHPVLVISLPAYSSPTFQIFVCSLICLRLALLHLLRPVNCNDRFKSTIVPCLVTLCIDNLKSTRSPIASTVLRLLQPLRQPQFAFQKVITLSGSSSIRLHQHEPTRSRNRFFSPPYRTNNKKERTRPLTNTNNSFLARCKLTTNHRFCTFFTASNG